MTYSDVVKTWDRLTDDERFILQQVAVGKINKQIAHAQHRALRTIEDRRRRLMRKAMAVTLADLIRFAVRCEAAGLMPSPDFQPLERLVGVA